MRRIRLKKAVVYVLGIAMLISCQKDPFYSLTTERVTVGFCAEGLCTRTYMGDDGLSTSWTENDMLSLWAKNSSGTYTLDGESFRLYGSGDAHAVFTSTLDSEMPQDRYTYYACFPEPVSVDGTSASFVLSTLQDGLSGGGSDILIAYPVVHGPLERLSRIDDNSAMHLGFAHLLHRLRFYIPEGADVLGEPILYMTLTMPRAIAGTVTADVRDPYATPVLSEASNTITLDLTKPIGESTEESIEYACASIFPTLEDYGEDDYLEVAVFSASKRAVLDPVPLSGRSFLPGHSTAVRIRAHIEEGAQSFARISFHTGINNLGEALESFSISNGSTVLYTYENTSHTYNNVISAEEFVGEEGIARYEEICNAILSGNATVTFDTEHVAVELPLSASAISKGGNVASVYLGDIPYLLFENFDTVTSFSSNDEYATSSTGSKSAYSFLDGWTGGRVGAQEGNCIRIAARRETSARYHARVDSAPLPRIKSAVNIRLEFDYGYNNQYFSGILTNGDYPMNAFIGYVTSTTAYKSGATDGTYPHSFNTGTAKNTDWYTPNHASYLITGLPAGSENRISWRGEVENHAGTNNTTCWLYIDNVRVYVEND